MLFKQAKEPTKKNLAFAVKWLRRASDEGDAEAHYELGLLYEAGEGATVDKVEAGKLYQKAVAGGFAKAEERLKPFLASLTDADRAAVFKG